MAAFYFHKFKIISVYIYILLILFIYTFLSRDKTYSFSQFLHILLLVLIILIHNPFLNERLLLMYLHHYNCIINWTTRHVARKWPVNLGPATLGTPNTQGHRRNDNFTFLPAQARHERLASLNSYQALTSDLTDISLAVF